MRPESAPARLRRGNSVERAQRPAGSGPSREQLLRALAHEVGNRRMAQLLRAPGPQGGGGGAGKRTIVLDGSVFDQINRANRAYADRLKAIAQTEDVYVSYAAYQEVVVNADLRRLATATRLMIDELRIKITPPATADVLKDVRARNSTGAGKSVLSDEDLLVAADAQSINGEVWSADRGFRNNAGGVRKSIGVQVSTDSESLSLVPTKSVQDYRVGRRLLGLDPVEINFRGEVTRPTVTPPKGGSGGGGSSGGAGSGPSTGQRVTGGILLTVLGFSKLFNWKIDHDNEARIEARRPALERQLQEMRAKDRHMGQLLVYRFSGGVQGDEGAAASARFEGITVVEGTTEVEARELWAHQRSYSRDDSYDFQWLDPVEPLFEPPWPVYGIGKFADVSKIRFQNVQFKEWGASTPTARARSSTRPSGRRRRARTGFRSCRCRRRSPPATSTTARRRRRSTARSAWSNRGPCQSLIFLVALKSSSVSASAGMTATAGRPCSMTTGGSPPLHLEHLPRALAAPGAG